MTAPPIPPEPVVPETDPPPDRPLPAPGGVPVPDPLPPEPKPGPERE